ncbi:winged helix-turn-helix domain-containing protein [Brevundimonas sp. M20]|uniref:winged helix-turn-helix domain-containing protein n=1 Tax=Brevundimonas sp. M20 TaxID=2591463 RepID=UPI0011471D23|nr:LysR family transcriptional regulator [Brevundimonas sp. M20]QDH73518.1 LysR family transcriptional regulator [Brevundimonas sp. M20]
MLARVGPVKLRLQVMSAETGAMGPGKAAVLEAIRTHGSITGAGRALRISYKRCWALVDEMNRCWRTPLVTAVRGGPTQGALLTEEGARILEAFRALEQRLTAATRDDPAYATLVDHLRDTPLPPAGS